jgi:dTDP-4-amino-4,6-dideoxygalactose transaminase
MTDKLGLRSGKSVNSPSDLAINGAPPAFTSPLHVGLPNIGNRDEFLRLAEQMFDRRWLSNNGPLVSEFEQRVAEFLQVRHCVAMCNGTIALETAIRATGMTGEVIVPSYTFIATAHALSWQGIVPVFADIDTRTHNISPESVRAMITPRTTGIIGVHLWGRAAPVEELQSIADEHQLQLMFDAAHAFGCSYQGRMIGGFGRAEVLSFHATKFFNSFEGGAVVTNDDGLAESLRLMRNFGFAGLDNVVCDGTNGKMTEVCAAMGLVNMASLERFVGANRVNHRRYTEALSAVPGLSVLAFDGAERNNYQYVVVEVEEGAAVTRDRLLEALWAENILARKYFWPGCHRMKPYRERYPHAGLLLRGTEAVSDRVMVLPTGAAIDADDIDVIASICGKIVEFSR